MKPDTARTVLSMTGQGHAKGQSELGTLKVEVRTINNRGFKCSPRVSDSLSSLESRIEALARTLIHRGTVHLSVTWSRPPGESLPNVDSEVLQSYVAQLEDIRSASGEVHATIDLASLLSLPGVIVAPREERRDDEALWQFVRQTVTAAIENLNHMRQSEGANMATSLVADCQSIQRRLAEIRSLAPRAADAYRDRLETKIQRVLTERELDVQSVDLLREVQIFADRVDISEETTRLDSHLRMFLDVLEGGVGSEREPSGRKLDFIIQEMFRETNTIGSKASDADISAHVVEIKCAIERMRELVQNLE